MAKAQVPNYIPADSLKGWWPFNGNANDNSPNANNGTVNGAVLTNDRFNSPNKAYAFNAVSSNIQTNWPGILGNNARTISFWFYSNIPIPNNGSLHGTQLGMVVWGSIGQGRGFAALLMDNNQPGIDINTAYKTGNINTLGNWTHYVLSYSPLDGSTLDAIKMYINGNLITDINRTFNIDTELNTINQLNLVFGSTVTAGQYFNGKLDDIGAWSRALTSAEIKNLYNACDLKVVQDPQNVSLTGGIGAEAKFFIKKEGDGASFLWQTQIGNVFQNITNSNLFQGQGTDTLRIVSPTAANNNQKFRCIINRQTCTDTSNSATLSILVSNNPSIFGESLIIFPNPSSGKITITGLNAISKVIVIDGLGREKLLETTNEETYQLKGLDSGIYTIKILHGKNQVSYQKVNILK